MLLHVTARLCHWGCMVSPVFPVNRTACTSGKVIIDDPKLPALPESAEEAHARISAVLEVSARPLCACHYIAV